ncbi:MAG: hypothetical protein OEV97_00025 [Betaproteobacteria bacterium]|nr:hypothetical protein [Betaproteobacteria bacterium]
MSSSPMIRTGATRAELAYVARYWRKLARRYAREARELELVLFNLRAAERNAYKQGRLVSAADELEALRARDRAQAETLQALHELACAERRAGHYAAQATLSQAQLNQVPRWVLYLVAWWRAQLARLERRAPT